jgi:hypothetical protein
MHVAQTVDVGHAGRLTPCSKAFEHPRLQLQLTGSIVSREKPTDRRALSVATSTMALDLEMTAWGRGCKAYIVGPNGVRPRANAVRPYTNTRRGTGILPVMFMARMAMPRRRLRLRRFALPALDGRARAAPCTEPEDESQSKEPLIRFVPQHLLPWEKAGV